MAHSIHTFTSDGLRAVMRMAERLQWDPIDKIERLETMELIARLCISHERLHDQIRDGEAPKIADDPSTARAERDYAAALENMNMLRRVTREIFERYRQRADAAHRENQR